MVQHPVEVPLAPFLVGFDILCLLVFFLYFSQSQPHATDASHIGAICSYPASEGVLKLAKLWKDLCAVDKDLVERW